MFLAIFLLKLCLKLIASEARREKISLWSIKKHRSAAVRRGARRVRPPPLDPLVRPVHYINQFIVWCEINICLIKTDVINSIYLYIDNMIYEKYLLHKLQNNLCLQIQQCTCYEYTNISTPICSGYVRNCAPWPSLELRQIFIFSFRVAKMYFEKLLKQNGKLDNSDLIFGPP